LKGRRQRDIGLSDLRERLRLGPSLVIAEVGRPLSWISRERTFDVWKEELRARVVEPGTYPSRQRVLDDVERWLADHA
jgi:hypothetical protein